MSSQRGVFIIHRIPGRVRLGVEALRKDPPAAERVAAAAARIRGVVSASASPGAASVTVEHDPATPLDEVLSRLDVIPGSRRCRSVPPAGPVMPAELTQKRRPRAVRERHQRAARRATHVGKVGQRAGVAALTAGDDRTQPPLARRGGRGKRPPSRVVPEGSVG